MDDHDMLITIDGKIDGITARLDKINGITGEHENRINADDVRHENLRLKVKSLERRPSPIRAILLVSAIVSALNGGLLMMLKLL